MFNRTRSAPSTLAEQLTAAQARFEADVEEVRALALDRKSVVNARLNELEEEFVQLTRVANDADNLIAS